MADGVVELLSSTKVVLTDRGTYLCCRLVQTHISSLMSSSEKELP